MVTVTETKEAGSQGRGRETAWGSASSTGEGLCHPPPTCTPTSAPITQPSAGGPYHFLSGEGPRFFLSSPNSAFPARHWGIDANRHGAYAPVEKTVSQIALKYTAFPLI